MPTENEWAIGLTTELIHQGLVQDADRGKAELVAHKVICMALRSQLNSNASELYRTVRHINDGHERGDPVALLRQHAELLTWRATKISQDMKTVESTQDLQHDLMASVKQIVLDMIGTWRDDNYISVADVQYNKEFALIEVRGLTKIGKEIIQIMMDRIDDDEEK